MTTLAARSSLAPLLAGYLDGHVDDDAMRRFDDLFETSAATANERAAFARFYLDVLAAGDTSGALPDPTEVDGILGAIQA